jgi:hypothetical protein
LGRDEPGLAGGDDFGSGVHLALYRALTRGAGKLVAALLGACSI